MGFRRVREDMILLSADVSTARNLVRRARRLKDKIEVPEFGDSWDYWRVLADTLRRVLGVS